MGSLSAGMTMSARMTIVTRSRLRHQGRRQLTPQARFWRCVIDYSPPCWNCTGVLVNSKDGRGDPVPCLIWLEDCRLVPGPVPPRPAALSPARHHLMASGTPLASGSYRRITVAGVLATVRGGRGAALAVNAPPARSRVCSLLLEGTRAWGVLRRTWCCSLAAPWRSPP